MANSTNTGQYQFNKRDVISAFPEPTDCLAAHLLLECSEVIGGAKPASLVSLVNRERPCGRNLYLLWDTCQQHLNALLPGINYLLLKKTERSVLLLCYSQHNLENHLKHKGIQVLLKKVGYNPQLTLDQSLEQLAYKARHNRSFPHEIGLFIGYPPKDVAAFMGVINLPFTCQGPWKIFGNPASSLCLADHYRSYRTRMYKAITTASSRLELPKDICTLFQPDNDNGSHYLDMGCL